MFSLLFITEKKVIIAEMFIIVQTFIIAQKVIISEVFIIVQKFIIAHTFIDTQEFIFGQKLKMKVGLAVGCFLQSYKNNIKK